MRKSLSGRAFTFFAKSMAIATTVLFILNPIIAQDISKKVIADVAGEKITVREFMQVYKKNNLQNPGNNDPDAMREYLDLYVNFRLKVKEAYTLGLDTAQSYQQELSGYRSQLAKPYMVDEQATDRLMKEAYARSKEDLRASHILLRAEKTASPADTLEVLKKILSIRERLLKGEEFADLAVEVSEDQSARDFDAGGRMMPGNKGDLGYFSVFDMVYPFENAAYALHVGEISRPVRTDFGYHLILLTDRKPAMGRVQVAHILLLNPPNANTSDSAQLKEKAIKIYNLLKSGESFDEIAATYSDDRSTADKGGMLQWFGSSRMIPDFIEQIFKLKNPGDLTEPFATRFGWHIVKLLEQKKPGTFEESQSELKEKVQKNERSQVVNESLIARIKKEYGFMEYRKALEPFYQLVTDDVFAGSWSVPANSKLTKQLLKIGKKKYAQQDFATYLASNQKSGPAQDIRTFVNSSFKAFSEQKVLDYEDSRLEKKYPEFRALMNEYRDGILLFELTDRKIWSKAVKDTTGLEAFYEKNNYNYLWGERVDASVFKFASNDPALIARVRRLAEKEGSDEQILEEINKDSQELQITRRLFSKDDNELVDKAVWTYGISEVTGSDGNVTLVLIHNTIEPGPKKLSEARGLVTADYQNYLEQEWIGELKRKYPVKINYDLISQIR